MRLQALLILCLMPFSSLLPAWTCEGTADNKKHVYFGDLHTHTSWSLDAYYFNAVTDPRTAHRFARQEAPSNRPAPGTEAIFTGSPEHQFWIDEPLDFNAITDHAEFIGGMDTFCGVTAQSQQACDEAVGKGVRKDIRAIAAGNTPFHTQMLQAAIANAPSSKKIWLETMQINDEENIPCTYTTLHGYEYTSNELSQMFHRNVIFNGPRAAMPTDVFGAVKPYTAALPENANEEYELFEHLQAQCRPEAGCEVLTIPHSANLSDGRMFLAADEKNGVNLAAPLNGAPLGRKLELSNVFMPMTAADALLRRRYDRSIEITQHKGQSECAIGLEGEYGDYDEGYDPKCNFEIFKSVCGVDNPPASCQAACATGDPAQDPPFCFNRNGPDAFGNGSNQVPVCASTGPDGLSMDGSGVTQNCTHPLDYYRNAMAEGLRIRQSLGVNPYRMNISASLDTHNGDSGNAGEDNYIGHTGVLDDDPDELLGFWDCNPEAQNPVAQRTEPRGPDYYDTTSTVDEDREGACPGRTFYDFSRPLNPGGLTGAWAHENTRDEIFGAIHRGETFGTSGPRMRVRTVASWEPLPADVCERLAGGEDLIDGEVVNNGARMGGSLAPLQSRDAGTRPHFAVWATQDPNGIPLQQIDLIKGHMKAEEETRNPKVTVTTIARSPAEAAAPERSDCRVPLQGRALIPDDDGRLVPADGQLADHPGTLCARWTDNDFDAGADAFWYARVLEVPSCRWSTHLCVDRQVDCSALNPENGQFDEATGFAGYEGCCTIEGGPGAFSGRFRFEPIEERAWASPIWYETSIETP